MKRFILIIGAVLLGLVSRAQTVTYTCRYWFDQNDAQAVTTTFCEGTWQAELDVGALTKGLHTLHIQAADTSMAWCSPVNYMFIKMVDEEPLLDSVDVSNLTYHCWFDQDHAHMQIGPLGNGSLLLDVSELDEGIHTLNILLEGSTLTSTQSYMFIKVAQQEGPLIDPIEMSNLVYHCWFDQDYENRVVAPISNGIMLLDVNNIGDGLHTVHILLEGEALTSTLTYMFLKKPEHQDFGIAKWQYYLNGDVTQIHTTEISPIIDTLDIITLLPVETWPVRSSCFHFHPNGDEPYLNAKNEVIFRFWSNDDRVLEKSAFYVDYQVRQDIVASVFEPNTTETFTAPRNNQITWYKLDAVVGDSLAFVADKACTMQLFAPSGEEVYNVSGPESVTLGGLHAWEDGTYYLAVHDVTGSGETVSVTYQYLHKYAVLAYDVHLVGNGGCSTITFQGNGFNSLLDAYLVNAQNDTIQRLDIGHESNTTTTVTFNFYEVNLGVYDAVFQFYDETIRINGALEVQEPVDIVLISSVSYPSQFLGNTPCTYTYTITNNGNMSAYAVPIYVYISTPTEEGISHLKFDGLDLASIISDIDLDSLSLQDVAYLKKWAEEIGDDHCFFKLRTVDEETGDSIVVRSNMFYVNIAPFETIELSLVMTANEALDVWMTIPNDIIQPITFANNRNGEKNYCCVKDRIDCFLNIICGAIGLADLISDIAGTTPVGWALDAADCICSGISAINTTASIVYCEEEGSGDFWDKLHSMIDVNTFTGWAASCISRFILGGGVHNFAKLMDKLSEYFSLYTHPATVIDCITSIFKPTCPSGDQKGGQSEPVNSLDPNDIRGYLSESGSHYMRQEIQNVQYEIEFENDTTLATAAAHTIIVRDTLDATKFDLNSLAARSVTIGDKRLDLNGEKTFARTLDLRPEIYVIAQVEQDYDPSTGIIQWTIQSLDPMTMEPTDNPYQGVLPVNYYGNGVGFIDYSINIKDAFADGTAISNCAGIIFDQNDVIMTPTWTNIVDAVKPTSHIESVEVVNDSLSFSFVSSDNRSGVWYHTLYYRNEATEQEWQVKKPQILENDFRLEPEMMTTEYLVMAVDSAGNVEEKAMISEYTYFHDGPGQITQTFDLSVGWTWMSSYIACSDEVFTALKDGIAANNATAQIKDMSGSTVLQSDGTWSASDLILTNEGMYMTNLQNTTEVTIAAARAIASKHPITINPGWNWIGFVSSEPMTLTDALANLTPNNGDLIKNMDGASSYSANGWTGSVVDMEPGSGYMYYNSGAVQTLVYPVAAKGFVRSLSVKKYWNTNVHEHATNLVMMATLDASQFAMGDGNYEIGAFVDGECRGSARLQKIGDGYVAFVVVHGEAGETVRFKLYDVTNAVEVGVAKEQITYCANAIMGSVEEPMVLHLRGLTDVNGPIGVAKLFPNPANKGERVHMGG